MTESNTVKHKQKVNRKTPSNTREFYSNKIASLSMSSEDYKVVFYDEIVRSGLAK